MKAASKAGSKGSFSKQCIPQMFVHPLNLKTERDAQIDKARNTNKLLDHGRSRGMAQLSII